MGHHNFKRTGILRAGFAYQDLVGVEVLIRFYRDPSLYEWVQLECEERAYAAVDDVVAKRPDGLIDVLQVKFTPDPTDADTALSWKWLLDKPKQRRSLLEKWWGSVGPLIASAQLGSAALRTDRVPDAGFLACLAGRRVDYDLVPQAIRPAIEQQLGSEANARAFFEVFEFQHSELVLADLEDWLRGQVAFDIDRVGWLTFLDSVRNWATLKGYPEPDGRIRHVHLMQLLTGGRPRPLPQDFEVPEDYQIPDEAFDDELLTQVQATDGVTVLWGSPGRGKSTYLSHCVQRLLDADVMCIRHHYFLSLSDRSTGRFHYRDIATSLITQLEQLLPGLSAAEGNLGAWISAAATQLASDDKRLVVVIDGLDHVWRQGRQTEHMEHLFSHLLPPPKGVHLVVGTQMAADDLLPPRLLVHAPKSTWRELPLMSRDAVEAWLALQDSAGRVNLDDGRYIDHLTALNAVATAFHQISGGLPLHLIYSFQELARRGTPVHADVVLSLPACPGGDIRDYYLGLWARVGPRGKDILHLLAALQFGLPPAALRECFGHTDADVTALTRIDHLLEKRETGVQPFHGSIFAFVREQPEHAVSVAAQVPMILKWLEEHAPSYWRWAWLWVTRAQFGDPADLVTKPDRTWALDSLTAGYPAEQIETILEEAERAAFALLDLPRTIELRSLKTRVLNGPEFQTDDWSAFVSAAVDLASDPYPFAALRSQVSRLPAALMSYVLRRSPPEEREGLAKACMRELEGRSKRNDFDGGRLDASRSTQRAMIQVAAHLPEVTPDRVVKYASQFKTEDTLLALYAREARSVGDSDKVLALAKVAQGSALGRELLSLLSSEGISLDAHRDLLPLSRSFPIRALCLLKGWKTASVTYEPEIVVTHRPDFDDHEATGVRLVAHRAFFEAFTAALEGTPVDVAFKIDDGETDWLQEALEAVKAAAGQLAADWLNDSVAPSAARLYATYSQPFPTSRAHDVYRQLVAVRLGLLDIAIDLQIVGSGVGGAEINEKDIAAASASVWWLDELWLDTFVRRGVRLHSSSGAEAFVARISDHLDNTIISFAERTDLAVNACQFALQHDLDDVARKELRRASDCLIGYGWRKDVYALNVLYALELLIDAGVASAREALLPLAPIYEAIVDFTDGDETDHVREHYYETLARTFPDRAVACFGELVRNDEWRYADRLALAFAQTADLSSTAGQALMRTFIQPEEAAALEKLAVQGRDGAAEALDFVRSYIGASPPGPAAKAETLTAHDEKLEDVDPPPNPAEYPPEQLQDYVSQLNAGRRYKAKEEGVKLWLKHWFDAGQGLPGLKALKAATDNDRYSGSTLTEVFDDAAEISLQVEGKSAAMRWFVLALRHRFGWQNWYTSKDEARRRLRRVAELYPADWRRFIQESAAPVLLDPGKRGSLVLGLDHLVYYLLAVGEQELAEAYTMRMVAVLQQEVSNQPLKARAWSL